jgi:hypothetical protein
MARTLSRTAVFLVEQDWVDSSNLQLGSYLKSGTLAESTPPSKIFLVLLGFYTANALAAIIGQTAR